MVGAGAICTIAYSQFPGTAVNRVIGKVTELYRLEISLCVRTIKVDAQTEMPINGEPVFQSLSFVRTARCSMDGIEYVPNSFKPAALTEGSLDHLIFNGLPPTVGSLLFPSNL